jgi:hypothetical protein
MSGVARVPYRLPELLAADDRVVYVVEGEKDAETLASVDLPATTSSQGAGKWPTGWGKQYFENRKVVVVPDNDDPGRAHAEQVAADLFPYAQEVRVLHLPDLPDKGDVSDYLVGHTVEDLILLVKETPKWEPRRKVVAHAGTAELLEAVCQALERYVVFPEKYREHLVRTLALWALHTYVYECFPTTPYLEITSPTKQSGKTRLFEVLDRLVARSWFTQSITAAVLFRKGERLHPTLLLDETDSSLSKDPEQVQAIRNCLNAGYRRGGKVTRCVGSNHDDKDFDVYFPKAFAGIGDAVPDTVRDRSIPIVLRRRARSDRVPERFREKRADRYLLPIGEQLAAWAEWAKERLEDAEPHLPDELTDRAQDCWEPLLAIAELAGGDWFERTTAAAIALHDTVDDLDDDMLLMEHIREAFNGEDDPERDRMPTADMLRGLVDRGDGSKWANLWADAVADQWSDAKLKAAGSTLARMLKPYGITPGKWRVGNTTVRGYYRSQFGEAWDTYLEPIPKKTPHTPHTPHATDSGSGQPSDQDCSVVPSVASISPPSATVACNFGTENEEGR